MTLSNFDWTDKASVRWFIMLPTGHEGPYSLEVLVLRCEGGKLNHESRIWAEGLENPITIKEAGLRAVPEHDSEMPELPSLPDEAIPPPLPIEELPLPPSIAKKSKAPVYLVTSIALVALIVFALYQWIKSNESFAIRRYSKMSIELQSKIEGNFGFEGWDKKIFFKEYVPADLSHIWLVTSSFQKCEVEAVFQSIKDKLISMKDQKVAFRTKGQLENHVVEFSSFDFTSGTKVVPGMYELDIKASNCSWDGVLPWFANFFRAPDAEYIARIKVILFNQGAAEFNALLATLLRAKIDMELRNQDQAEAFWSGLQQKFLTLNAITMQIEQHLLDFLSQDPRKFAIQLRPAIDSYTTKYGTFLTKFVVTNEEEFNQLANSEIKGISQKRNYELMVHLTVKKIGLESMRIIEDFQALKKPNRARLKPYEEKIRKTFAGIKEEINQKIIQISEDRSH